MKKIYLDVCSLHRPFDNQDYARISLETDAVNLILSAAKNNRYSLMTSPVHIKEIQSITERLELLRLLDTYGKTMKVQSAAIRARTESLLNHMPGVADAAHVAFAEYFNSTFISCDDKLLSRCVKHSVKVQCLNPVVFCEMENLK